MDRIVHADPVFLGLTRPATMLGVPYTYLLMTMVMAILGVMITRNPMTLLLFAPIYVIGRLICRHDVRQFAIIASWLRLRHQCPNGWFWQGNHYSEWGNVR